MPMISRQIGHVSSVVPIFIQDATVSTGAGLANVVASSVSFTWKRNNQAAVSTGTCTSTGTLGTYGVSTLTQWSSTAALGWYDFCPPDGVFTSGGSVGLHLYGAPSMAPVPILIELTKFDNQVYISSHAIASIASNLDKAGYGVSSVTDKSGYGVSSVTDKAGYGVSSVTDKSGYGVSSITPQVSVSSISNAALSTIATMVWQDSTSGDFTTVSSIGNALYVAQPPDNNGGYPTIGGANNLNTVVIGASNGMLALWELRSSTAQAGGASTITLDSGASSVDDFYKDAGIDLTSGTGASQTNLITAYNGSTRVASVSRSWATQPTSTTAFLIKTFAAGASGGSGPAASTIALTVWQVTSAAAFATVSSIGNSLYNAFTPGTSVYTNSSLANAPTGGSAPAASTIALTVWQVTSATAFATVSSIGNSLYNAFTPGTSVYTNSSLANAPTGGSAPAASTIALTVWQVTSATAFSTVSSVGNSLYNAFTPGTSVYTNSSLANAPTGGSAPAASTIAAAVWQDAVSSDFLTVSSIGKALYISNIVPGAASGHSITGAVVGVSTVTDKAGYGVSSVTDKAGYGVSSISTPVGVTTFAVAVGVSSFAIAVGVSSVSDKSGYGVSSMSNAVSVSTLVGVSTFSATVSSISTPVGVSSFSALVGVSTITTPVGVSTVSDKAGYGVSSVSDKAGYGVSSITAAAASTIALVVGTTAQIESYRANGATGSLVQLAYEVVAHMGEVAFTGTTKTLNGVNHSTSSMTFQIDSSTAPTSITRNG